MLLMSNVQACLSFPGQGCGPVQHQEAKEGCQEVPSVCGEAGGEGGGAVPRPQQVRQDEQALETLHQQVAPLSSQGGYCPSIRRCGYCDVPYRVIARAETVQEDQQYIGHMANVEFQKIGREQFSMSYTNVF